MLRVTTALVTILILTLYGLLVYKNSSFSLLSPRGGMLTLCLSLVLANAAVWASQQPYRTLSARFQLVFAGWIWLAVQLGATCYFLVEMT